MLFVWYISCGDIKPPVESLTYTDTIPLVGGVDSVRMEIDTHITLSQARNRVIDWFESQTYVRELTGKNDGKEVESYLLFSNLKKGDPWCAAFLYTGFHTSVDSFHVLTHPGFSPSWFRFPVTLVYSRSWKKSDFVSQPGQVIGLWIPAKNRIGHVEVVVYEDKNNYYTIGGNTNQAGSDEGDGVYKKIRPKTLIYSISDPLLNLKYE